jgi:hypothetical protein
MNTIPSSAQRWAKLGVLRQEAKARMHRLGAGRLAGGDDLVGHQVALIGRRRTDVHRLVGHLHGQAVGVGVRIDHHRGDPQPTARLDHPHRDLAPVGDQELFEHPAVPYPLSSLWR